MQKLWNFTGTLTDYRPHKKKTVSNYSALSSSVVLDDESNDELTEPVHNYSDIEDFLTIDQAKQDEVQSKTTTINTKPHKTLKRKANDDFEQKFLALYSQKTSKIEDEYYHFGQIVAEKLRALREYCDPFDVQMKILELIKQNS